MDDEPDLEDSSIVQHCDIAGIESAPSQIDLPEPFLSIDAKPIVVPQLPEPDNPDEV